MVYFLVILVSILLLFAILLQVLSLPGNWAAIGIVIIWKFIGPASSAASLTWLFILLLIAIAAVGEALEWYLQLKVGKKYGGSLASNIAGIIGAIVGAITFLPLFFGAGALLGALLGAFTGCLVAELLRGRPTSEATKAAWGAFLGRFLGIGVKLGLGFVILSLSIHHIWPVAEAAARRVLV